MHGKPPALHRGPRRCAELVDVMPGQMNALGDERVEVGADNLGGHVRGLAVKAHVRVTEVTARTSDGGAKARAAQGGEAALVVLGQERWQWR